MRKNLVTIFIFALMVGVSVPLIAQDPSGSLAHSWRFNDGTANDAIGTANAILQGGAEVFDGSLWCINTGAYLEMPAADIGVNTYDEVSAEIWFKSVAGGNASYHMIVYFGNTTGGVGDNGFFITPARGDNVSRFAISCGNTTAPYGAETGVNGPEYDDGELHHMVGTITSTDVAFFVDGASMGTAALSPANSIANIIPTEAFLAKSGYTGDANWTGEILEFNLYNRALTPEEVSYQFTNGAKPVGINDASSSIPKEYRMSQNYPNPFNPTTTIEFALPRQSNVRLTVINMLGQVVRVLLDGPCTAGTHRLTLDASNLTSGVYFYRLQAENFVDVKKLTLLK